MIDAKAAVLTPGGRGAIASVRVWGQDAVAVADSAFRPNAGPRLAESPVGRLRVGRIGAGMGDEVVAVVLDDGAGPEVEVQCHGGPAAVGLVLAALAEAGALRCEASRWAEETAGDPISAAATIDLARAPTARAAEILLDQAGGALSAEIRRIAAMQGTEPDAAAEALDALIGRAEVGLRLVEGWRAVLAGRPNVGKSALLNALAGFERAIVAPTPGTTRDVVTARVALDGWPVELADTAGLRATGDEVEAEGVALARARQAGADLVLLVLDRSEQLTDADRALIAAHPGALVVANKADLPPAWAAWPGVVAASARRGDGLEDLASAAARRLVPAPPPPGAAAPFRREQVERLEAARRGSAGDPLLFFEI